VARAKFIDSGDFDMIISRAIVKAPDIAEKCLRAGADIIADEMKIRLQGILSPRATGQLVAAFGITPVRRDTDGNFNVHLGFDGYRQPRQKNWPQGVPFQLIARSFESGAGDPQWRKAKPFAAPAVNATQKTAYETMKRIAEKEFEKLGGEK